MWTDIDVVIKSEFELSFDEQNWHENYINNFKYTLDKWFDGSGLRSYNRFFINISYLPEIRKFRIDKVSPTPEKVLQRLKEDTKFYSKYFVT